MDFNTLDRARHFLEKVEVAERCIGIYENSEKDAKEKLVEYRGAKAEALLNLKALGIKLSDEQASFLAQR